MRVLLDTHVLLWWIADDPRVSRRAARAIANPRNDVFVSAVSAWETVTKASSGRLRLPGDPRVVFLEQLESNGFSQLPITIRHAIATAALPGIHRDPFDRLLIAQAIEEDLALVSGDDVLGRYPVRVLW